MGAKVQQTIKKLRIKKIKKYYPSNEGNDKP
jgi:hypothetical protein